LQQEYYMIDLLYPNSIREMETMNHLTVEQKLQGMILVVICALAVVNYFL
jgi:hypothetical protein